MSSLRYRQIATGVLMFCGYASLYFCRADLSVSTPLIIEDLRLRGMSHDAALIHLGQIASMGVLAYALGKLFLGGIGDVWGGRISFLIGLAGATLFTVWFSAGTTISIFMLAWVGNRLTQSMSWAGLIKISSKWYDYPSHGMVIGMLSISYLVGDAGARQSMGVLIHHGAHWQTLFYYAAAVAAVCFLANVFFLRESRVEVGFTEATSNPLNLFATEPEHAPRGLLSLMLPLLRSPSFLLVCLLSLGCTIIREAFNTWTPAYLTDYLGFGMSEAAGTSAIFPAVGALSIVASGWLSDRAGANGRALLLFIGLVATAAALVVLMTMRPGTTNHVVPLVCIAAVALCLLGPYSYLGGAFALDFGGKRASALASGLIDGVGYLGGVAAGEPVARLTVSFGWKGAFMALAAVSAVSALCGGYLYRLNMRAAAARAVATRSTP